jgi:Mn-dependent DtxR family transcriptional regulator
MMENKQKINTKEIILDFLRKEKEPLSISEIMRRMKKYSYPTTLKWVTVLESDKKLKIIDYGNIKLVVFNKDE